MKPVFSSRIPDGHEQAGNMNIRLWEQNTKYIIWATSTLYDQQMAKGDLNTSTLHVQSVSIILKLGHKNKCLYASQMNSNIFQIGTVQSKNFLVVEF